jgi:hypothetical protein
MATAWNYFNRYEIIDDGGFPKIKYIDGGDYDYSSPAEVLMLSALHFVGIEVPHYMKCEPPKSGKLELVEPEFMLIACNEVIELLKLENVPLEKVDKRKELVECIKGKTQRTIELLEGIKEWSEQGYYITVDID